jgi:hypothetical protein
LGFEDVKATERATRWSLTAYRIPHDRFERFVLSAKREAESDERVARSVAV